MCKEMNIITLSIRGFSASPIARAQLTQPSHSFSSVRPNTALKFKNLPTIHYPYLETTLSVDSYSYYHPHKAHLKVNLPFGSLDSLPLLWQHTVLAHYSGRSDN
ncbi:hypothetical protein ABZP36_035111 [Zizania latifolia]